MNFTWAIPFPLQIYLMTCTHGYFVKLSDETINSVTYATIRDDLAAMIWKGRQAGDE
jgi:hypothetical protein